MDTRFSKLQSNAGFSVIQALVVSGIFISLFAGVAHFSVIQNKSHKKMAMKFELQDFRNTLAQALAIPSMCRQVLTSIPTSIDVNTPAELTSINLTQNRKLWDVVGGKPEGSTSGLSIESIKFVVDGLVPSTTDRFIGHLEITPRLEPGSFPIASEILRQVVVVDSANKIIDCISTTVPSCPLGQIYSGLNSNGTPNCISLQCPAGKVVSGVSSSGLPTCVDETQITLKSWSCPTGQAVRSISSEGVPDCVSINAVTTTTVVANNPPPPSSVNVTTSNSNSNVKSPCTGGVFKEPSADQSNKCEWNVPDAQPGVSIGRISGSNSSWVEATCSSSGSGEWNYTYHCPSTRGTFTCSGGGYTATSPDGTNSCHFTWGDTSAGRTINISSANGGTGTATCTDPSGWSHFYSCPNSNNSPTCPGGGVPNYPSQSGKAACTFSWAQASVGTRINISSSSGLGRATAYCKEKDVWVLESVSCE